MGELILDPAPAGTDRLVTGLQRFSRSKSLGLTEKKETPSLEQAFFIVGGGKCLEFPRDGKAKAVSR